MNKYDTCNTYKRKEGATPPVCRFIMGSRATMYTIVRLEVSRHVVPRNFNSVHLATLDAGPCDAQPLRVLRFSSRLHVYYFPYI